MPGQLYLARECFERYGKEDSKRSDERQKETAQDIGAVLDYDEMVYEENSQETVSSSE